MAGKEESSPPPVGVVLGGYVLIGAGMSFGVGREPGTVASSVAEVGLPLLAMLGFVMVYSVFDVMQVGAVKAMSGSFKAKFDAPEPEEVYLAVRAQTNQVEQMPSFFVSTAAFALLVNGPVGGCLAWTWVTLRFFYARTYRNSAGVDFLSKGLGKFTIPCYFILNGMAAASFISVLRALF